jgi:hypothetical protein
MWTPSASFSSRAGGGQSELSVIDVNFDDFYKPVFLANGS